MPNVPKNKLGLPTVSEIAHLGDWHMLQWAGAHRITETLTIS